MHSETIKDLAEKWGLTIWPSLEDGKLLFTIMDNKFRRSIGECETKRDLEMFFTGLQRGMEYATSRLQGNN